jgi:hypothetical protein
MLLVVDLGIVVTVLTTSAERCGARAGCSSASAELWRLTRRYGAHVKDQKCLRGSTSLREF